MPDRIANVLRSKKSGHIAMVPLCTFIGYGGYVGTPPYELLPPGATAMDVGETLLRVLERSGPTGVHIEDAKAHLAELEDATTRQAKKLCEGSRPTTAGVAARSDRWRVEHRHRRKSVTVTPLVYDSGSRTDVDDVEKMVRVALRDGAARLGECFRSGR